MSSARAFKHNFKWNLLGLEESAFIITKNSSVSGVNLSLIHYAIIIIRIIHIFLCNFPRISKVCFTWYQTPCAENVKKNVHEEPYFRSLSASNNWPSQAHSEAHRFHRFCYQLESIRRQVWNRLQTQDSHHALTPTCWMQSENRAKLSMMKVTKLWNRHTIESMHLKRFMAISSVKERWKQKSQLKNSKEWWNIWTVFIWVKVEYNHCFAMFFSHVCHPTITNKLSKITMIAFIWHPCIVCSHFHFSDGRSLLNISLSECFCWRTQTAEDHLVSLWELLEEESIIAHKLACSCDRHNIFVNFCTGCPRPEFLATIQLPPDQFPYLIHLLLSIE